MAATPQQPPSLWNRVRGGNVDQSNSDFADDIRGRVDGFFFCSQIPVCPRDESSLVTEEDAKIPTRCEGHDSQINGLKWWWGFFREPRQGSQCGRLSGSFKEKEREVNSQLLHQTLSLLVHSHLMLQGRLANEMKAWTFSGAAKVRPQLWSSCPSCCTSSIHQTPPNRTCRTASPLD